MGIGTAALQHSDLASAPVQPRSRSGRDPDGHEADHPARRGDVGHGAAGRMKAITIAFLCATLLSGCLTLQTYEGPKRPDNEVARISGDPRVTAGSPITVTLREVDGNVLNVGQNSVDVLPGEHRLLVDCRIAETKRTSRHSIDAEVYAGRRYRLVAETVAGLRGCRAVGLG